MKLSTDQDNAIARVAAWYASVQGRSLLDDPDQVFCVFGYAGTGKTTIAREFAEGIDGKVAFCAFTGKAAHVLAQKGCVGATTIHKLIYQSAGDPPSPEKLRKELEKVRTTKPFDAARAALLADELKRTEEESGRKGPRFRLNLDGDAKYASLIVVDEVSMVDERVGRDLLAFGKPVLVLGDPAQLPPVMGGGFFTRRKPNVLLEEIHRQAADSPILRLATMIRRRQPIAFGELGEGCRVISKKDPARVDFALAADQILCGRNLTRHATNRKVRSERGFGVVDEPKEGDRLMCLRNEHELGFLNGQMFTCKRALSVEQQGVTMIEVEDEDGTRAQVTAWLHHFRGTEDKLAPHMRRANHEFAFGYAITVHKSQGSEWPSVYVFDESDTFGVEGWQHLYTAVTRASSDLTVAR